METHRILLRVHQRITNARKRKSLRAGLQRQGIRDTDTVAILFYQLTFACRSELDRDFIVPDDDEGLDSEDYTTSDAEPVNDCEC